MAFTHPVIIVGGSLNGLATALLLTRYGIKPLVVERHRDTTIQYKFAGISPRSMEIFRWAGIEDEIRANKTGDQKEGEIARGRNLTDPDIQFMGKPWRDMGDLSATSAETCDQDVLEPIMRRHAAAAGADIRFHTELVDFTDDRDGVRATVRDLDTGKSCAVSAPWMVAADGIAGTTRAKFGIGRSGPGILQHWMNLIFETDLQPYLKGRRFTSCFVTDVNASVTPRETRWLLSLQYQPDKGEKPEDFDAARVRQLVRKAAGDERVRADLYDAREWAAAAYIAERFKQGHVFLLGDAAHSMPPTGGFGGNIGIHDANNLAWKLAYVLDGRADPILLDSYDVERRYVAEHTLAQSMARLCAWFKDTSRRLAPPEPIIDDANVIFGYLYPNGALSPDSETPKSGFENPTEPSGAPGSRAPHVLLSENGRPVPVHDLLDGRLTMLGMALTEDLRRSARAVPGRIVQTLDLIRQPEENLRDFRNRYHVAEGEAVIVRPDGFIAWRSLRGAPRVPADAFTAMHLKQR